MESLSSINKVEINNYIQKGSVYYDKKHPFGYNGGTFPEELVRKAIDNAIPLTLDLAIPGTCLNNCIFCGYYDVNSTGKLSQNEILNIIEQFANLGGKSIKILGEGEPLLRKDIILLLNRMSNHGLIPVLFTCGDVIGDDNLAIKFHGISGYELANILYEIGCTIVLKYEAKDQDDIVQREGFSKLRDKAFQILMEIGFNKHFPSRFGFGTVLLRHNYNEIPIIYKYALENNIYPLICPLMPIGKTKERQNREILSPSKSDIAVLKASLKHFRKNFGIDFSIESDFPGGLPCDIARVGFYIDDIGNAFICESDDVVGNIREFGLNNLWAEININKNAKYGEARHKGLCFPKRRNNII